MNPGTEPMTETEPVVDLPDDTRRNGLLRRVRRPSFDISRDGPYLLVAAAVVFAIVLLRSELREVYFPNDASMHSSWARFAQEQFRAGRNPFDPWYPFLGLGAAQFHQYQVLSHIVVGALSAVVGDWTFRWSAYLLICTWPISVYIGARLLGLDRWQAATAALVSPLAVNNKGYGFEWGSFLWLGSGMWSMLWALWLLPIAWGLSWRAVARGERYGLTAFVVGLTCALHFLTGYLVLLSLGVFVVVRPHRIPKRLLRAAVVGVGGLLIFAFVFIPTVSDFAFVNRDVFNQNTFWADSFGPGNVFSWLVSGEVFDSARLPVLTILAALGLLGCGFRVRTAEWARILPGLLALSLALYSGRHVVGPVIRRLPGGSDLLLHRYITGVHLAGFLLAGVGTTWLFRRISVLVRSIPRFPAPRVVGTGVAVVLIGALLLPAIGERKRYADSNAGWTARQAAIEVVAAGPIETLLSIARENADGRVYAGASNNWGRQENTLLEVPLYMVMTQTDTDGIGFYLRTASLNNNVEPYFDERNPAQYDLFNIRYVLLPDSRQPPVPARAVAQLGGYSLYRVETSGYLKVVDATEPIAADRTNMAEVMRPLLASPQIAGARHPLVAFAGRQPEAAPSASASNPPSTPPGRIDSQTADLETARFSGKVTLDRPGWVMLKESYHPRWRATVDGKTVTPEMLAPAYVGVPVPAGEHTVTFEYDSISSYPYLIAFGLLVLVALIVGPRLWRRERRRRAAKSAVDPL